jgi:hypothetical protein
MFFGNIFANVEQGLKVRGQELRLGGSSFTNPYKGER